MTVKVVVFEVGQKFACAARLVGPRKRTMGQTRDFPYGMDAQARASAEAIAERNGWTVQK